MSSPSIAEEDNDDEDGEGKTIMESEDELVEVVFGRAKEVKFGQGQWCKRSDGGGRVLSASMAMVVRWRMNTFG